MHFLLLGSTVDPSRRPRPEKELVTLEEYRLRHAQYKTDVDLQNLHVGHPFITIWGIYPVPTTVYVLEEWTNHLLD